ncbi:S-adenosyl-L-methionine-dependent methyltransferases superfamily protein [Rhynchospora pubera]|uniref:S-adenosyl-L-methionine-dependent methyltransferases superfamily protein n=1 Tax=Rhynchospora pubera TaxID=906938 RepID=A0AAV8DEM9_9POAL|nr:S-adenosyl-L-methionine-dependent methyltransferases superfamily protein [Rhynchospora pubera]
MATNHHCSFLRHSPLFSSPWRTKKLSPNPSRVGFCRASAQYEPEEPDPLLRAALTSAWIRDQESRRSDPLFIDTYAGGLLSSDECLHLHSTSVSELYRYRLATKFIDERLQQLLSTSDQFRQIVLLSDGMDTRPYRLNWPRLSVIYDLSPERAFALGTKRLQVIGAKTSRNCLLFHFPNDSRNLHETLCKNGFNGNQPSLWMLQGLPLPCLNSFEELLLLISSLAMKGSIFFGELRIPSDWMISCTKKEWLENVFLRHGFRGSIVKYSEVAGNSELDPDTGFEASGSILFVAEQLRVSDAQMEVWRMHLERMDEEADEDGFEEL